MFDQHNRIYNNNTVAIVRFYVDRSDTMVAGIRMDFIRDRDPGPQGLVHGVRTVSVSRVQY